MMADRAATQRRTGEPSQREQPLDGSVTAWKTDLGRGFIRTVEQGDYYVDRRFVSGGATELTIGRMVMFMPRPPLRADGRPVAACVLQDGQQISGPFVTLRDRYGFIEVRDSTGNQMNVFVYLGDQASSYDLGQTVTVTLTPSRKGGLQGVLPGQQAVQAVDVTS